MNILPQSLRSAVIGALAFGAFAFTSVAVEQAPAKGCCAKPAAEAKAACDKCKSAGKACADCDKTAAKDCAKCDKAAAQGCPGSAAAKKPAKAGCCSKA